MWAIYVALLVVGLGILLAQVFIDSGDDAAHGGNQAFDKDIGATAISHDAVALFLSLRFWIFFALAAGLSGLLMTVFALASPFVVGAIAGGAGIASGLFAALAFRAAKKLATTTSADAREAVGLVGRVLVPCSKGRVGQIRIALKGQTVDLMATTDEAEIARGEAVLVEDIRGEIAHVSPRPPELA